MDNERAKVLLKACFDMLTKARDSSATIDVMSETVAYDGTDCDGFCLRDDIASLLDIED